MKEYLVELLKYIEAKNKLKHIDGKPVSSELVEKLLEYYRAYRPSKVSGPPEMIDDSYIYQIRTGLVVHKVVRGKWLALLGRECIGKDRVGPRSRLKTPGGDVTRTKNETIKNSVIKELVRELKEEGFRGRYEISEKGITPVSVATALPRCILQFYSSNVEEYPPIPGKQGEMKVFSKSMHGKIITTFYDIDTLVEMLSRPETAVVHNETIETLANCYFWNKSRRLVFEKGEFPKRIAGRNSLRIPDDVRVKIFENAGLPFTVQDDMLRRCSVYYTTPSHTNLPYAKIFFSTDIFLEELLILPGVLNEYLRGHGLAAAVRECAKDFIRENLVNKPRWSILYSRYLSSYGHSIPKTVQEEPESADDDAINDYIMISKQALESMPRKYAKAAKR